MRVYDLGSYDAAYHYEEMRYEFAEGECWACGRPYFEWPENWDGVRLIERAHIVNKPRREDRRAVVMLCTICHQRSHGEKLSGFDDVPQLTLAQLLTLKRDCDRAWYDLRFLEANNVGQLPQPERLPAWFYEQRGKFALA